MIRSLETAMVGWMDNFDPNYSMKEFIMAGMGGWYWRLAELRKMATARGMY